MMSEKINASIAIAVVFYLFIFYPIIGLMFPALNYGSKIVEKRRLKDFPSFNIINVSDYPEQFESFFNDHFGLRNFLIRINNLIKFKLFNKSEIEKVLVGKKGWLFYTGNAVVDDYRGVNSLSDIDLEHWRRVIEAKRDWLSTRGISYLFVVAPNKHSIYPEYLPDGILKVTNNSPADQILEYLAVNSDVDFLDLRGVLRSKKNNGLLYYPTGTHWTDLGAFFGYREIIMRVAASFPQIKPITLNGLKTIRRDRDGLDLAAMLGIQDLLPEKLISLSVLDRKSFLKKKGDRMLVMENRLEGLPKALMFRDSFAIRLIPFLSENFSSIQYITKKWHKKTPINEMINENKPDIVIEEWCERYLKGMGAVSFN